MNYDEIISYLNNLNKRDYNLELSAVSEILEKLGNPHLDLKVIHVAGTNGKGSVCAILSSVLGSAGFKVGMYTSPHLKKINERVKVGGLDISDSEFVEYFNRVLACRTNQTYFELVTALAFLYFAEKKVDYAVLEVGMGGRLDATNVVSPLVSVITNISLEHQEYLGDDVIKIAGEKAGIIKEKTPVVTGCSGDALGVVKKVASEKDAEVVVADGEFESNLKGDFQKRNAAIAVKVAELLGIKAEVIQEGLKNVKWPGRFERKGDVILDCAHNIAGIEVLKNEILKIKDGKVVSVVGILNDKDKKKLVETVSEFSDHVIFCKPKSFRASEPSELASYCSVSNEVVLDVNEALEKAKSMGYSLVVVCGSIYSVGEVTDGFGIFEGADHYERDNDHREDLF